MAFRPGASMSPAFPRSIRDSGVREVLRELLGVGDPPDPVPFTVEDERYVGGARTLRLSYPNMLGESVPSVLVIPQAAQTGRLPAVVCAPGTSGDADLLADERFGLGDDEPGQLRGWARELSDRGFVTLSVTLHLNDARRGTRDDFEQKAKLLAPYGITPMGLLVDEVLRGVRLLSMDRAVDPARIGLTGFSLGGNATWYAFACAPWLRAAAVVCGGLGNLHRQAIEGDPGRHGPYFYVPGMLRFFDHPTIVRTCIAPRPLLVIAPMQDEDMPASGVEDLLREVEPAYERLGAAERFSVYRPEAHHEYRVEYLDRVAGWFHRHLVL